MHKPARKQGRNIQLECYALANRAGLCTVYCVHAVISVSLALFYQIQTGEPNR